jgi:hypothetical protein
VQDWAGRNQAVSPIFLGLVHVPDGIAGASLGLTGSTAPNCTLDHVATGGQLDRAQKDGYAGDSQSGLDYQLLLANEGTFDQEHTINELGSDGNSTFTSDGHAIQAHPNTGLSIREGASSVTSVVDKYVAVKPNIDPHGALIGERPIGISDFDICFESSTPSSQGTITNLDVFKFEQISLVSFESVSSLV